MRLKICGITREGDALAAARLGYALCGFVFHDASPRHVTVRQAAAIGSGSLLRVGVFVNEGGAEIRAIMREARLDFAQLHGEQSQEDARDIGLDRVIRVLWPRRYVTVAELEKDAAAKPCAFFLLESGMSGGGSGREMDWNRLANLKLPRPFFLAGGLTPDNVTAAARCCGAVGMDLNSGVEIAPGIKDHGKMAAVAAALKGKR